MSISITYKNIFSVALPIILSGVAQNIVVVTDTAFLGQLGDAEIGAAGNAGIFYFVLIMAGMGLTTGSQIIIGRRNGENNYNAIGSVFQKTITMMLPLALIFFLFVFFISPHLLQYIVKSDHILELSNEFLYYRSFGIFFAFVNFCFIAFYVGITHTKVLTYGTILIAGANIFLDYGLIFGNFGLPELGVKGAALASSISEGLAFIFFVIYTLVFTDYKKYNLFNRKSIFQASFKRIISIGSPIILQNILTLGSWLAFFIFIEYIGERELAISHIVRSIYMVLTIPLMGFSQATNSLVSNLIGARQQKQVLQLIKRIIILCSGITFLLVLLALIFQTEILTIYTSNGNLIEDSKPVLYVISISIFFFSTSYILFNGVTGTGNTKVSLLMEFLNICIYLVCTYFIAIVYNAPIEIVWCSEFIYFTFLGIMAYGYLKKGNWQNASV